VGAAKIGLPGDPAAVDGKADHLAQVYGAYAALRGMATRLGDRDLAHRLVLCEAPSAAGDVPLIAASIASAGSLCIEPSPEAVRASMRSGAIDFAVTNLDEALRALKNELRKGLSIAVCLEADPGKVVPQMIERGVQPHILCQSAQPDGALRTFIERGALVLALNGAGTADALDARQAGREELHWSVSSLPGKWLPMVDEIVASCLPTQDHTRREWLQRAPRYLGRATRTRRYLALTNPELHRLEETLREEMVDPRWNGLHLEFDSRAWKAVFECSGDARA